MKLSSQETVTLRLHCSCHCSATQPPSWCGARLLRVREGRRSVVVCRDVRVMSCVYVWCTVGHCLDPYGTMRLRASAAMHGTHLKEAVHLRVLQRSG